jgi:hypothetical protein
MPVTRQARRCAIRDASYTHRTHSRLTADLGLSQGAGDLLFGESARTHYWGLPVPRQGHHWKTPATLTT